MTRVCEAFYTYLNAVIVLPVGAATATTAGGLGVGIERDGKGQLHLGSFASREVRQPVTEHNPQIRHIARILHLIYGVMPSTPSV